MAVGSRWRIAALGLVMLTASQGCVALGLSLLAAGAGTAAGQGISYNVSSVAYKTFTVPIEGLEAATLKSLLRMEIEVRSRENRDQGVTILAEAGNRDIDIDLDRLTGRTSRLRVEVKLGWFLRDQATAAEIIAQTTQTLDGQARTGQPMRPLTPAPVQYPVLKPASHAGSWE